MVNNEEVKPVFDEKLVEAVKAKAREAYKQVHEQREEIMRAFAAKYKCEPDDMVQVEWNKSQTQKLWFVVRKQDCIYCAKCRDLIAKGEPVEIQNN
jgi:hypothetical protein